MHTSITKRRVQQKNREGRVFTYDRYFLHYSDPGTGKRRQRRFDTRKAAEMAQAALIRNAESLAKRKQVKPPILAEAVAYWLRSKKGVVNEHTYNAYTQISRDYIIGPAIKGSADDRRAYGRTGKIPKSAQAVPMLGGATKIETLTTAQIRSWFLGVLEITSPYVAKCAKRDLSSILRLIEEDFDVRLARMPSRPGPAYRRGVRRLLSEDEARRVIEAAQNDPRWGVYYAFPFLTGVRPSEMLGLLWEDVNMERRRIHICRTQRPDGSLKPFTKTAAGMREIPMSEVLHAMLQDWQGHCPRVDGALHRVFPAGGGGPLSLHNFRMRVWYTMLDRLGLPQIAPYAARHMAISHLQAQGVEVGLVAKIAGHSSPQITLHYYTHAVREGTGLMDSLSTAYGLSTAKSSGVQE